MQKFNPFETYKKGERFEINGEIYEASVNLKPHETPPFIHVYSSDWADKLDGNWENGVWCMCDRAPNFADVGFVKILSVNMLNGFRDHLGGLWENATPLQQNLADQLESLSKKSLT